MSFDTSWDPESYRTPFESDEHWKLKLDFIQAHKERFPEDRLICLAQVFANVELMGCKYPDKVMEQVGELAEDIAAAYQASRENKIKRTFASAQEAAGAKVRAPRRQPMEWGEKQKKKVFTGPVAFVKAGADGEDEDGQNSTPKLKPGVSYCSEDRSSNEPLWMKQQRDDLYHNQEDQIKHMTGFVEDQMKHMTGFVKASAGDEEDEVGQNSIQNMRPGVSYCSEDRSSNEPLWMKQQRDELYLNQKSQTKHMTGFGHVDDNEPPNKKVRLNDRQYQGIDPQWQKQQCESQSQPGQQQQQQRQKQQGQQQQQWQKEQQYNQPQHQRNRQQYQQPEGQGNTQHASSSMTINISQGKKGRQVIRAPTPEPEKEPPPCKKQPFNRQQQQHRQQHQHQQQPELKLPGQRNNDPLSSFVIVTRKYQLGTVYPLSIINDSAAFNGTNVMYDFSIKSNMMMCKLSIGGIHITSAKAECKKSAKDAAAAQALQSLRSRCHTLQVLKKHIGEESVTTNLVDGGGGTNEPLPQDNFGSKLLKMMGWSGGGLGKHGTGIAEPIKAETVIGRQGLGMKAAGGVTHDFKQSIKKIVQDYVSADQQGDLIFSSDFSKEQRAEIHTIARRMNLKSQSTGSGVNRFLAISRKDKCGKRNVLQEVLKMGGETEKYKLLKPGEEWDNEDNLVLY